MNQKSAEKILKQKFHLDKFYPTQWETIDSILKGKRILLIEKTGFGKSLCYQFPATQLPGITIVFSPLIALMRDQVKGLIQKNIKASYINSEQSIEDRERTIQDAKDGKIKILYIAPERQENQDWINATREMNLSMIVVDEAHTISVWGHDFRPAFRRIVNLVKLLPQNMPVLATTATSTLRVQKDIEYQLGNIQTIRGNLIRKNLQLYVIKVNSEDEKLCWLGRNFEQLEGNGIIYTGTRTNTTIYSRWLEFLNHRTCEYNAGLDGDSRKNIENTFMANQWKAVVSTNALGMGIDKSDIRFIIHTQVPASPIHYYQEIGRAGRDGKNSKIIMFYNESKDTDGIEQDYKLPKSFIDGGRPAIKYYHKVIDALKEEQLGEQALMKKTNLKQTQIRVIKADLIEQKIIKEVLYGKSKKYEMQYNAPELNTNKFEKLREQKLDELNAIIKYVNTTKSRMDFLCRYLGDDVNESFKNCDNTGLKKYIVNDDKAMQEKLIEYREQFFPELKIESKNSNIVNGIASSYYGVSNVGAAIHRCKYEDGGDFPDFLIKLTLKAYRKKYGREYFDLIIFIPPTESGDLVKIFSEKLSRILKIPISHKLNKHATKPQKIYQNWLLKKDNVYDSFYYTNPEELKDKSILLIDDVFDSGWTIKEVGRLLTNYGVKKISPIVIAKTVGGNI